MFLYQVVAVVLPGRKRPAVLFLWSVEPPQGLLTSCGRVVHTRPVSPSFLAPTPSYCKQTPFLLGRGVRLTQAPPLGLDSSLLCPLPHRSAASGLLEPRSPFVRMVSRDRILCWTFRTIPLQSVVWVTSRGLDRSRLPQPSASSCPRFLPPGHLLHPYVSCLLPFLITF